MERYNQDKLVSNIVQCYNYNQGKQLKYINSNNSQPFHSQPYNKLGLEKIAREISKIQNHPNPALKEIRAPEKKLIVMIIGNHSAGKSSFINWYVEKDVQKTKVAIETIEINILMQGQEESQFNGFNAMQMLPFLKGLYDKESQKEIFPGLLDNVFLKSVNSSAKDFKDVILIDTPGLADGDLKYRFEIDGALSWFADRSDLILIFLDPNGQALCKKTTNLIASLHEKNQQKLNFYMTKGDMFESDEDRFKCMCQITQGLSLAVPPRHGFQMPIIFIPQFENRMSRGNKSTPINQIQEIVQLIKKKSEVKTQHTLSTFNNDLNMIEDAILKTKQEIQQSQIATSWVEQTLIALDILQFFVVLVLIISWIEIMVEDKINEKYTQTESSKSLFHFLTKIFLGFLNSIKYLNQQFGINEYKFVILPVSFILTIAIFITIRVLPQKYKKYSVATKQKVESFHIFLQQTKIKQKRFAQQLKTFAFSNINGSQMARNTFLTSESETENSFFGVSQKEGLKMRKNSQIEEETQNMSFESNEEIKLNKKFQ